MRVESLHALQLPILFFFVGLLARACFSFLETSITALRLFKVKELATSLKKYRFFLYILEKNPHRVLITIVIANSLADVTTASLVTYITESFFAYFQIPPTLGFPVGIALGTGAILVFGEIIPKNIARSHGEWLLPHFLWLANGIFYLFYPLVSCLMVLSDFFIRKFDGNKKLPEGSQWVSSEKELQFLIGYISDKGLMEPEKTLMLQSIFNLGDTPVKNILIPRDHMVSINEKSKIKEAIELFAQCNYTRLPIYRDTIDNIVGMIYLKDVFRLMAQQEEKLVKEVARPILTVQEDTRINALLREFRQRHMHIAIVHNEKHTLVGLITLEDILEEIVGEIADEHEK